MPKGLQGQKRPTDVIGVAILVGRIATGEAKDTPLSALNKAAFRPSEYRPTARAQEGPPKGVFRQFGKVMKGADARSALIQNHDIRPNRSGRENERLWVRPSKPCLPDVFFTFSVPAEVRKPHREGAPVMI